MQRESLNRGDETREQAGKIRARTGSEKMRPPFTINKINRLVTADFVQS